MSPAPQRRRFEVAGLTLEADPAQSRSQSGGTCINERMFHLPDARGAGPGLTFWVRNSYTASDRFDSSATVVRVLRPGEDALELYYETDYEKYDHATDRTDFSNLDALAPLVEGCGYPPKSVQELRELVGLIAANYYDRRP